MSRPEQCAFAFVCARDPRETERLQAARAWKVIRCIVCQHYAKFSVMTEMREGSVLSSGPRDSPRSALRDFAGFLLGFVVFRWFGFVYLLSCCRAIVCPHAGWWLVRASARSSSCFPDVSEAIGTW